MLDCDWSSDVCSSDLQALPGKTLVHGHCHQKAVGAMKSLRKVLRLIPQFEFEFIEASCCGGAGHFCLEAEHAEAAMQMAELDLLPALRAAPDSPVLANGFSCRQQIEAGCGRQARHVAVLLREALAISPTNPGSFTTHRGSQSSCDK
jgi:Fe-S oxidoreductase